MLSLNTQNLPAISPSLALTYKQHKKILLYKVEVSIQEDESFFALLKNVAQSLLHDYHRYHIALLANVFELNNYQLLTRSLVWEYRAYFNQGVPYEFFLKLFEVWQKVLETTLDKESAKVLKSVYAWMHTSHRALVELSQEALQQKADSTLERTREQLTALLLQGKQQEVLTLTKEYLKNSDLNSLFDEVIQPSMQAIGRLWEYGNISCAKEHLATTTITKTLSELYANQPYIPPQKGVAVVTSAPNEYHELGAWMVANALEEDGWEVFFLGANTPAEDIIKLLQETEASILAISAVVMFHLDGVKELIQNVKQDDLLHNVKVMIGGHAFDNMPELVESMKADAYLKNAEDAIKQARLWYEGS